MMHTDVYYQQPVVCRAISMKNDLITIDTDFTLREHKHLKFIPGTFFQIVSYVSNDAAICVN